MNEAPCKFDIMNTQVVPSIINGGITALCFILWGKGLKSCGPVRFLLCLGCYLKACAGLLRKPTCCSLGGGGLGLLLFILFFIGENLMGTENTWRFVDFIEVEPQGSGSGFVWDKKQGHILYAWYDLEGKNMETSKLYLTRNATGLVAPAIAAGLGALTHALGTLVPVIGASGFATAAVVTTIGIVVGSFR